MKILPCGVAVIEGDQAHAKWIEELGTIHHDPWMRDQVLNHIKPGDVVIDGGANIGTLTKPMLDAGAQVFAFEPNPEAVECIRHNCPNLQDPSLIICAGLSAFNCCMDFVATPNAGASFCKDNPLGDHICRTIDWLSLPQCNLIKLDIEGFEVRALRGAARAIARCKPVLICEVNKGALERAGTTDAELLGLIEDMGYTVSVMQPDCRIGDPQYDILCLPK